MPSSLIATVSILTHHHSKQCLWDPFLSHNNSLYIDTSPLQTMPKGCLSLSLQQSLYRHITTPNNAREIPFSLITTVFILTHHHSKQRLWDRFLSHYHNLYIDTSPLQTTPVRSLSLSLQVIISTHHHYKQCLLDDFLSHCHSLYIDTSPLQTMPMGSLFLSLPHSLY